MLDTMLGTGAPPQNRQPSPCPRQYGGKTDKRPPHYQREMGGTLGMSNGSGEEKLKEYLPKLTPGR